MGDLQTEQGESLELRYVPVEEFTRVVNAKADAAAKAAAFAALARINTLYMIEGAWSGHIGTSFSSLEIMSWLFLNELRDLDKGPDRCDIFFSSKGHDAPALYAALIGLGLLPAEKLLQLRRLGGLPGHPHVETPYIQANTGSLGMGISKAKGMALANRLAGTPRRIFVLTGDGELQEGQFWESLGSAANMKLGEIVAIIDHNKIQSDTWVRKVSDLGDLEAKLRAFGWHVSRCDGHDVAAIERTLRSLDAVTDRPKAIVADTINGRGVSFMEGPHALPIAHSFACFLSTRPNEQISNQCSESSRVIYFGSLAGVLPGGPGHWHQSVRDISALGAVPNLLLAEPAAEGEVRALLDYLIDGTAESAYLRLVSVKWPLPFEYPSSVRVEVGKGWVVRPGKDALVLGYGPWMLSNAWHAAEEIEKATGARVRLVNLPWLNRVDAAWLKETIGGCRTIVTVDNQ